MNRQTHIAALELALQQRDRQIRMLTIMRDFALRRIAVLEGREQQCKGTKISLDNRSVEAYRMDSI